MIDKISQLIALALFSAAFRLAPLLAFLSFSTTTFAEVQLATRTTSALNAWRLFPEAGEFRLDATFFANASSGDIGEPAMFAPDLWYGFNDQVAAGLVHSSSASTGFYGLPAGICYNSCGTFDTYHNIGARALVRLNEGSFALAADSGVIFGPFDPTEVELRAGIASRVRRGDFSFELNPAVHLALNDRDSGDNDFLLLPATFRWRAFPELTFEFQSGVWGALAEWSDTWIVPLSIGGVYKLEDVSVGLRLIFPTLGAAGGGDRDFRTFEFYLGFGF